MQRYNDRDRIRLQMVWLSLLFLLIGGITSLNDILIPHMKEVQSLNFVQASLIQFSFFGAYFIASPPCGVFVAKVGRQVGITTGLLIAGVGCLACAVSTMSQHYAYYLAALFLLACGIVLLQVSCNASVTLLGRPETAARRLVLAQGFNSLGAALAPLAGGVILATVASRTLGMHRFSAVQQMYLGITAILIAMTWVASQIPNQRAPRTPLQGTNAVSDLLRHKNLCFGAAALFLYVGAEVAIGSFLTSYVRHVAPQRSMSSAGIFVAMYWVGALFGRFVGSAVLRHISPARLLTCHAMICCLLVVAALMAQGMGSVFALTAIGLFNSIMFPTIFSMALRGLENATDRASGLLCMAVVGGAIVPVLQAAIADRITLATSFVVPLVCYVFILIYGISDGDWRRELRWVEWNGINAPTRNGAVSSAKCNTPQLLNRKPVRGIGQNLSEDL